MWINMGLGECKTSILFSHKPEIFIHICSVCCHIGRWQAKTWINGSGAVNFPFNSAYSGVQQLLTWPGRFFHLLLFSSQFSSPWNDLFEWELRTSVKWNLSAVQQAVALWPSPVWAGEAKLCFYPGIFTWIPPSASQERSCPHPEGTSRASNCAGSWALQPCSLMPG